MTHYHIDIVIGIKGGNSIPQAETVVYRCGAATEGVYKTIVYFNFHTNTFLRFWSWCIHSLWYLVIITFYGIAFKGLFQIQVFLRIQDVHVAFWRLDFAQHQGFVVSWNDPGYLIVYKTEGNERLFASFHYATVK